MVWASWRRAIRDNSASGATVSALCTGGHLLADLAHRLLGAQAATGIRHLQVAAAPPGQGRLGQHHVHHVGGQHGVGAGAAEVNGDDLGQVPDDALGIQKPQGQFLLPPRQAHQDLKRLAPQADLQGFLDNHHVGGFFYRALPVAPDGEFFDGISHG